MYVTMGVCTGGAVREYIVSMDIRGLYITIVTI